jgi:next-to-BRCA1 protein 1
VQLQARFIEDVTIPDGCVVNPSANLRKSWKLENSGDQAWPAGCFMVIQEGNPAFGVQAETSEITLPALQPGEQFIADVNVVAPAVAGRYTSYWRVCDPWGVRFGHRFWIDIIVAAEDDVVVPLATACVAMDGENASRLPEAICCDVEGTETADDDDDDDEDSKSESDSSESESDNNSLEDDDEGEDGVEIVDVAGSTETTDMYADALAMLASMGFADEEKNRRHLEAAEGNITNAVVSLLAE